MPGLLDFASPQHTIQYFRACIISNRAFCEGEFTLSICNLEVTKNLTLPQWEITTRVVLHNRTHISAMVLSSSYTPW